MKESRVATGRSLRRGAGRSAGRPIAISCPELHTQEPSLPLSPTCSPVPNPSPWSQGSLTLSPLLSASEPGSTPVTYMPRPYSAPPRMVRPRDRPSPSSRFTYRRERRPRRGPGGQRALRGAGVAACRAPSSILRACKVPRNVPVSAQLCP